MIMPVLFYDKKITDRVRDTKILIRFFSLFDLMTRPYFRDRIHIGEARVLYEGLLSKYYISDYKTFINNRITKYNKWLRRSKKTKKKKSKKYKKTFKKGGSKKCRRKIRIDKNGEYNKSDIKHNEKCAQQIQPWMKEILNKDNKSLNNYEKFLKKNIKKVKSKKKKLSKKK